MAVMLVVCVISSLVSIGLTSMAAGRFQVSLTSRSRICSVVCAVSWIEMNWFRARS